MRATAFLFVMIIGFLMIQPAFANFIGRTVASSCAKIPARSSSCMKAKTAKPGCARNKCSMPPASRGEDNCKNNRCNPLMGCPSGNFYLINHTVIAMGSLTVIVEKRTPANDNRVMDQLSDCWHPPELFS